MLSKFSHIKNHLEITKENLIMKKRADDEHTKKRAI